MIAYPAMLDVPTELLAFLGELLAQERVARGTRTGSRALSCTDQAVFTLVWFRESRDIPLIGKGIGDLPDVDTDRLRVKRLSKKATIIDAWYSGTTHDFGGNIQALFRPDDSRCQPRRPSATSSEAIAHNVLARFAAALDGRLHQAIYFDDGNIAAIA
ncbi:MAG: hypothetical protein ACRDRK_00235 [Pseudonocardia sp.]